MSDFDWAAFWHRIHHWVLWQNEHTKFWHQPGEPDPKVLQELAWESYHINTGEECCG